MKRGIAYLASVIDATLIISIISSQLVLADVASFGLDVPINVRLATTVSDLAGLGPRALEDLDAHHRRDRQRVEARAHRVGRARLRAHALVEALGAHLDDAVEELVTREQHWARFKASLGWMT